MWLFLIMTRSDNMKAATFDHAALLAAFEAVKDNHGCAGVDGQTIGQFEKSLSVNLARLRSELNGGGYFPLPLMKIQVAKKNGEPRGLCIPTVRDRVAQTAVLHRIKPLFERQFEECSFAYRQGRSVRRRSCGSRRFMNRDIVSRLVPVTQKFTQASFPP
jgi:retron-type reverse transcriptase